MEAGSHRGRGSRKAIERTAEYLDVGGIAEIAGEAGVRGTVIDQAKFVYLVCQQPVFAPDIMRVLWLHNRTLEGRDTGQD